MKFIVQRIVKIIISFLKDLYFKIKKDMLDKSINNAKEEAQNAIEKNAANYTNFDDLYSRYKSGASEVRDSSGELRNDGEVSEGGDKQAGSSDK